VTNTEFDVSASPEAIDYLTKIAAKMSSIFGISRSEAIGRINQFWKTGKFFSPRYEWLLFHETVEDWAKTIYYGPDAKWWLDGESLSPQPYPKETPPEE
jgi:hypothetical protein